MRPAELPDMRVSRLMGDATLTEKRNKHLIAPHMQPLS